MDKLSWQLVPGLTDNDRQFSAALIKAISEVGGLTYTVREMSNGSESMLAVYAPTAKYHLFFYSSLVAIYKMVKKRGIYLAAKHISFPTPVSKEKKEEKALELAFALRDNTL